MADDLTRQNHVLWLSSRWRHDHRVMVAALGRMIREVIHVLEHKADIEDFIRKGGRLIVIDDQTDPLHIAEILEHVRKLEEAEREKIALLMPNVREASPAEMADFFQGENAEGAPIAHLFLGFERVTGLTPVTKPWTLGG